MIFLFFMITLNSVCTIIDVNRILYMVEKFFIKKIVFLSHLDMKIAPNLTVFCRLNLNKSTENFHFSKRREIFKPLIFTKVIRNLQKRGIFLIGWEFVNNAIFTKYANIALPQQPACQLKRSLGRVESWQGDDDF